MTNTVNTAAAISSCTDRQFTKKPVTIQAIQWTGRNLREVIAFTDGPPDTRSAHAGMAWDAYVDLVARDGLKIYTLEGKMSAAVGDWIIKGVKGEHYPCKPDIFEATYSREALAAQSQPEFTISLYPPQPTSGFRVGMPKGVKVTHNPTGLFAVSEGERSQHRNRDVAMQALQVKLAAAPSQPAAPAPAGEYPAGTGNPEADRIICRLASSDPDFDDCADAVALIHKLVAEIKGPDGFATWKDAAIADRAARGAAQPAPVDTTNWQPVAVPAAWAATSEEGNVEALGMNQSRRFDTPLYLAPQPVAREPQWSPASTPPKESDGEVLVRMADGRCEIAWATYWHGSSNAFAQWTFRDPDEEETPVEWMLIPHGIKGGQHGTE